MSGEGGGMWGAAIQAGGGLGGSAIGLASVNRQLKFQERMSNTAYRRAMEDMKLAGLNPMMMYGKGGGPASTPTGAAVDSRNPMEGVSAAMMASKQNKIAQAALSNATQETQARVNLWNAEAELARARAVSEGKQPGMIAQNIAESIARIQKLTADTLATQYGYKSQYWKGESAEQDYHQDKAMGLLWERLAGVIIKTFEAWDKITPPTAMDLIGWITSMGGGGPPGLVGWLKEHAQDTDLKAILKKAWETFKTNITEAPGKSAKDLSNRELR